MQCVSISQYLFRASSQSIGSFMRGVEILESRSKYRVLVSKDDKFNNIEVCALVEVTARVPQECQAVLSHSQVIGHDKHILKEHINWSQELLGSYQEVIYTATVLHLHHPLHSIQMAAQLTALSRGLSIYLAM